MFPSKSLRHQGYTQRKSVLDVAWSGGVFHLHTHICAPNHPGLFSKQKALRQHCLLLPLVSPVFQQVCLCTGLQCLPVSLSILTFALIAQRQTNLTERW